MTNPEAEHASKIGRLLNMNPKEIEIAKIKALIGGVHNKELTEADILQFTNITEEQLRILFRENSVDGIPL